LVGLACSIQLRDSSAHHSLLWHSTGCCSLMRLATTAVVCISFAGRSAAAKSWPAVRPLSLVHSQHSKITHCFLLMRSAVACILLVILLAGRSAAAESWPAVRPDSLVDPQHSEHCCLLMCPNANMLCFAFALAGRCAAVESWLAVRTVSLVHSQHSSAAC
jgi:hypothetical protein